VHAQAKRTEILKLPLERALKLSATFRTLNTIAGLAENDSL